MLILLTLFSPADFNLLKTAIISFCGTFSSAMFHYPRHKIIHEIGDIFLSRVICDERRVYTVFDHEDFYFLFIFLDFYLFELIFLYIYIANFL